MKIGGFGKLIYAGKNWTDPALSRHSMELMAEKGCRPSTPAIRKSEALNK